MPKKDTEKRLPSSIFPCTARLSPGSFEIRFDNTREGLTGFHRCLVLVGEHLRLPPRRIGKSDQRPPEELHTHCNSSSPPPLTCEYNRPVNRESRTPVVCPPDEPRSA